jgi:hypothetical protein
MSSPSQRRAAPRARVTASGGVWPEWRRKKGFYSSYSFGWALRGKIAAKLGDSVSAGTELQHAFSLVEQLQSPSLLYPIAYDLGQWYESAGNERDAAALYSQAKATIDQMAMAVEDEVLRSTFLQSALVQEIHEGAARLGE